MKVEKSVSNQKQLQIGVGLITPIMFNPTRNQLNKLLNYTPEEEQPEIEYFKEVTIKQGENEKQAEQFQLDLWFEDQKKNKGKITFYLANEIRYNKDGSKEQWANQYGRCFYSPSELELPSWFCTLTTKDKEDPSQKQEFPLSYHKARIGEENLLAFLAAYTDINNFNINNSLFLENEKDFWKGSVKELNNLIGDFNTMQVMAAYEIKTKQGEDGETKEYQVINSKNFCSGRFMRQFNNYYKAGFDGLSSDKKSYNLGQFVKNMQNPQTTSNYFELCPLKDYDGTQNPVNSSETIISETNSSY